MPWKFNDIVQNPSLLDQVSEATDLWGLTGDPLMVNRILADPKLYAKLKDEIPDLLPQLELMRDAILRDPKLLQLAKEQPGNLGYAGTLALFSGLSALMISSFARANADNYLLKTQRFSEFQVAIFLLSVLIEVLGSAFFIRNRIHTFKLYKKVCRELKQRES